jgi:hypothetical protein
MVNDLSSRINEVILTVFMVMILSSGLILEFDFNI